MEGWRKMKKYTALMITLLAMLALCTTAAFAETGKFTFGSMTILPSLGLEGVSDDNIYLGNGANQTTEKVVSDWVTHVKPAVLFDYKFGGRGGVKFGYKGDLAYYSKETDNDWQSHIGAFDLNYYSPGGLILGIKNVYTDTSDPFSNDADYLNASTEQVKRWLNRLDSKLGYKLGDSLKVLGFYNYYIQDYENKARDFSQDYNDNELGAGVEAMFLPKTWGFLRYHYGLRDYTTEATLVNDSNDSDYTYHRVNAGIGWDGGAKLSGEFNLGYQWRKYENEVDSFVSKYEDKNTWIAATDVKYSIMENTRIGAILRRELKETGSNTNEFNVETAVGINLSHTAMEKIILAAGYEYTRNEYNTNNRDDRINRFNIGVDYKIQPWLTAGAEYILKIRDSTVSAYDYDDNQVLIKIKAGF